MEVSVPSPLKLLLFGFTFPDLTVQAAHSWLTFEGTVEFDAIANPAP